MANDRASVLIAAMRDDRAPRLGEGSYKYLTLVTLPSALREQAKDALFFECDAHVTVDAWNIVKIAADALEQRASASPDPVIAKLQSERDELVELTKDVQRLVGYGFDGTLRMEEALAAINTQIGTTLSRLGEEA